MSRAVRRAGALLAWAACGLAAESAARPGGLAAQAAVDLEADVAADSVRVGEAFAVRLAVGQARSGEVRFPALLDLPASLEQTEPVRIRSAEEGRRWEAEYTLVAWRADTIAIPPVEVELVGAGGVTRTLDPPAVVVRSVLPDAADGLSCAMRGPSYAWPRHCGGFSPPSRPPPRSLGGCGIGAGSPRPRPRDRWGPATSPCTSLPASVARGSSAA